MQTFQQFLAESAGMGIHQFPLLSALPRGTERLGKIVAILNPAITAGTIQNVQYEAAKYEISGLHEAMQHKLGNDHTFGGRFRSLPEPLQNIELTLGDPHHIPGKLKKLEKMKVDHPFKSDYQAYAAEMMILVSAMAALKEKITKRQPKPEEERNKQYIPASASHGAMGVVTKVLKRITDETKHEYAKQVEDYYVMLVEERFANPPTRATKGKQRTGLQVFTDSMLMSRVGEEWDSFEGHYKRLASNWKSVVKAMADRDADDVQLGFLAKNVRKLSKIIEDKGNLKGEPEVIKIGVMTNGFYGEIRVHFEDGAVFTVRNKAVEKVSENGKPFTQFPTTFHDVKLPGGKAMSNPSEERMIEVFAKTK